jgi:hypothetical protein
MALAVGFIDKMPGWGAGNLLALAAKCPSPHHGRFARQLGVLMREERLTKTMLAKRMQTSRAQLDRVLDPDNESVTLGTLARAAHAVGRKLRLELV